jgi:hypothetical protein
MKIDKIIKIKNLYRYKGLNVKGDLDLSYTQIQELPEGLNVEGNLDLSCTQIRELPEGLSVEGYLNLKDTQIRELPESLSVGGINLRNTQVRKLPESLIAKRDVYSNIPLNHPKGVKGKIVVTKLSPS